MLLASCFIVSVIIPVALNREIKRSHLYHVATGDQITTRSSDDGLITAYHTEDSYKIEKRDANEEVRSVYSYMTPGQEPHTVSYIAETEGYRTVPLDQVPPLPLSLYPTKSKSRENTFPRTWPWRLQGEFPGSNLIANRVIKALNQGHLATIKSPAPPEKFEVDTSSEAIVVQVPDSNDPAPNLESSVSVAKPVISAVAGENGTSQVDNQVTAIAGDHGVAISFPNVITMAGLNGAAVANPVVSSVAGDGGVAISGGQTVAIAGYPGASAAGLGPLGFDSTVLGQQANPLPQINYNPTDTVKVPSKVLDLGVYSLPSSPMGAPRQARPVVMYFTYPIIINYHYGSSTQSSLVNGEKRL